MFKELKLKIAARRVERSQQMKNSKKANPAKKTGFWATVWNIISWPFRAIARLVKNIWQWIRCIDLIGLVNLTLLVAIIVLFSMLIIDMCGCRKKTVVLVAAESTQVNVSEKSDVTEKPIITQVRITDEKFEKPITLPLKKIVNNGIKSDKIKTAQKKQELYGPVIVDGEYPETRLSANASVKGNVYLQNMRRYTLPCDIRIEGDLFLRNVDMLKFCGDFVVTGNIYVSKKSSFGPIPRTARLGGQVIL